MDHGTLTDNNGRKSDFRHVIIVLTTNAGAQEMNRPSIGCELIIPVTAWKCAGCFTRVPQPP
jgi:hypothetical protein